MGLCSLDTWVPYCWETGEVFDLPEFHMTVFSMCPVDGNVPLTRRALSVQALRFVVDRLLSLHEAQVRISGSDGASGSCAGAGGDDSRDEELAPKPDDDDGDDWYFADVPVDSRADGCAGLRRDFDDICELCR